MTHLLVSVCLMAGALYGAVKDRSGAGWGKPVALLCSIALIATAGFQGTSRRSGKEIGLSVVEQQHEILGYGSDKLLAERFPGRAAILIPDLRAADLANAALLRGLHRGGGDAFRLAGLCPTIAAWLE